MDNKTVNTIYVASQPPYKIIKYGNKIGVQIGTQRVIIAGGNPFRTEEYKPKLHLNIIEMQQEAEQWMYEFFAKLRQSMLDCRRQDENGNDLFSPEDIEKYFYSYLMEKVGEAYRTCIECHRRRINELVERISADLQKRLGLSDLKMSGQTDTGRIMRSMSTNVTRSVMSVKLFGTSETFPPAAMSTFSVILKKKKLTTDVIDIALENYDEIRINIVRDIKNVYQDLEVKALQRLDDLYHHQAEAGREALNQAKQMLTNSDAQRIRDTLARANALVEECIDVLEKYPE